VVGGAGICDPVGDRGRHHRHGVEGVGQRLLVPRAQTRCPRRQRRRRHMQHEGWADLLRRKAVGESAGHADRRGRLLDVDHPGTRPHLDGAGPGVEVGRPRGVAAPGPERWWWCRCRGHHCRHGRHHRGCRSCRAAITVAAVGAIGRRCWPSEVVAQHTEEEA
jgi:hypothetical protein